jgi:hypothetical protein
VGPITLFSRAVTPQRTKLAAYEQELIGFVKAMWHWWPDVWTWLFTICTDHFV